ncbi:hypothetical protein B0J12DRAFT_704833 [Macrophomina phaseolina]|uniref:Uncharacterized protein n=1 Tax=Macrophomina phaseolina TaxID=35725 RepID=A0ABQ8FWK9_9PEZI|nr:hypothetical protein B0J12DRAFT_704833 [Macrophomina phaseolina]
MLTFAYLLPLSLLFAQPTPASPLINDGGSAFSPLENTDLRPLNKLTKRQGNSPYYTPNYQFICLQSGSPSIAGRSQCAGPYNYVVACDGNSAPGTTNSNNNNNYYYYGTSPQPPPKCPDNYFCEDADARGTARMNDPSTSARCLKQMYAGTVKCPGASYDRPGQQTGDAYCLGGRGKSFHARVDTKGTLGKTGMSLGFVFSTDGGANWYPFGEGKLVSGLFESESLQVSFDAPKLGQYVCFKPQLQTTADAFEADVKVLIAYTSV